MLKALLIIGIVIVCFFLLTFVVYIFNLDMKLLAKMKPLFMKGYDKRKRERKI